MNSQSFLAKVNVVYLNNADQGRISQYPCVKVKQSNYRPEVPRRFQEVKVPRLRDNDLEWW